MALLKSYSHDDPQDELKGIGPSRRVLSSFFTKDPLVEDDSTNINKPGRSIPSMFARMIYFRTAFESVGEIRIPANKPKPIYNQLVSRCLDVLYLVYSRDPGLTVVRWNKKEQLEKLQQQNNFILKEAIEKQCNDYLLKTEINAAGAVEEVFKTDDIYLFFIDGTLIGGTSPFTFTFASPDWKGLGGVKSLLDRELDFREYVYKLHLVYSSNPAMKEFNAYVNRCLTHYEQDKSLKALEGTSLGRNTFANSYSQYSFNKARVWVSQTPEVPLYTRKPDSFASDFFIDSPFQTVDVEKTPLFLCDGYHNGFRYVGATMWNSDTNVNSLAFDDNDTKPRKLPGLEHSTHVYLSVNDFLEPVLLKLPYVVDCQKFSAIVDEHVSYLLPLRPMFFKYFGVDKLNEMFVSEIDKDSNICKVVLRIPVANEEGQNTGVLEVEKEYNLNNDVKLWAGRESVNLGIFPFYRIPQNDNQFSGLSNRYVVMHNINGAGEGFQYSELAFYKVGNKDIISGVPNIETNGNTKAVYYHLDKVGQDNSFDYIRMNWKRNKSDKQPISGIVIPNFLIPVGNGNQSYVYAIDFGTTNTHVAYKSANANPQSFAANEINLQAGYLNAINNDMYQNSCGSGNGEILENEKRHFFPHVNDNSYTFPLRTASKKQGVIDGTAKLFSSACIGFHYPKEFIRDEYEAELKWKLDNERPLTEINQLCKLFFEELLWMIKNHWVNETNSNKSIKPTIVITYPQAMTMQGRLIGLCRSAYENIFECDQNVAKQNVTSMVESLAPCFRLINGQGLGNNALLNIDIGGGTTDLQYYREWILNGQNQVDSYYTSVLFAGDDLWGKVYEHVDTVRGAENTNNFKKAALRDLQHIRIEGTQQPIENLQNLDCKEFITLLLRDDDHIFTDWLSNHGTTDVCRKTMFLHYSAIIYYAAIWLRDNGLQNPMEIQFTGLGSKYINLLFGDEDKGRLAEFTKGLITKVTGNSVNDAFSITISNRPKHATAEGAALYNADTSVDNNMAFQPGIDGMDTRINGNELADYEEDVMKSFSKFIDTFNSLPGDINGVYIPKLSEREKTSFTQNARISLQQMIGYYTKKFGGENAKSVNDPMFFWPFKGALSLLT